jgi:hypothetical protein
MQTIPSVLDDMLAVWNSRDHSNLRTRLEAIFADDIVFVDPTIITRGIDEFEANVRGFRAKYPQADIRKTTGIDSHHNLHRYHWAISMGGKTLLEGFDVSETNADGKVTRVLGFFGPLSALA